MRFHWSAAVVVLALVTGGPAFAEEEKETGWSSTAELGFVVTGGNSETQTLSFKEETTRTWDKSSLRIKAGAIRAETTTTSRFAVQTPAGITETETKTTNAETYYLETRFDREISKRFFWFAGAGWDRNRPAGIDSRTTGFAGVGNVWRDDDKIKFRTDYAVSYTDQEDVVVSPTADDEYIGARASWVYKHQLTESTEYSNDLVLDFSLEESDDWRGDMINAISVALNGKLALKVSLQHLYNNSPALQEIDLYDLQPPAGTVIGTALFELDEIDTLFSTSLVIKF